MLLRELHCSYVFLYPLQLVPKLYFEHRNHTLYVCDNRHIQNIHYLNMNLSMNRAYNVANYVFILCRNKPYYNDLTKMLRVEGASFSKPILVDGKEDYKRSRRVELRLVLKPQKMEVLQQFLRTGNGSSYEKL